MRPRARIILLIGNELIGDEPVAVVELVKSAYDAEASQVRTEFSGVAPAWPVISIPSGVSWALWQGPAQPWSFRQSYVPPAAAAPPPPSPPS